MPPNVADEIDKNAAKVGVGVEAYQELAFWADQNGVTADQLRQGLGDLNTRVGQAVTGNKTYSESFEKLGISLTDANGKTRETNDILRDVIDRLSKTENAAERTALAGRLFGDRFSKTIQPALAGGVEGFDELTRRARENGQVLDAQTVSTLVNYKDRMAAVRTELRNAGITTLTQFLPAIEGLTNFTTTAVVPALSSFADWIDSVTTNITEA